MIWVFLLCHTKNYQNWNCYLSQSGKSMNPNQGRSKNNSGLSWGHHEVHFVAIKRAILRPSRSHPGAILEPSNWTILWPSCCNHVIILRPALDNPGIIMRPSLLHIWTKNFYQQIPPGTLKMVWALLNPTEFAQKIDFLSSNSNLCARGKIWWHKCPMKNDKAHFSVFFH